MGTHPIFESDFDCLTELSMTSGHERTELSRYIRLFCTRAFQAVVQSRLKAPDSESHNSIARPNTPDWFHLNMNTSAPEMRDINDSCKAYLASGMPNCRGEQLVCQVSKAQLDTNRAQVLEIWQITIEEEFKDSQLKIQDVYEKQCIMLKSIIALSRTLPAYNVARDQHEENFHIKYNIYKQQPDLSLLGESRGSLLMGRILTPHGELVVQCTYRRLNGFGRPSNTPSFRTKSTSRRDINVRPNNRTYSECSNSPSTMPPPQYAYSGSPGTPCNYAYSSPIKARQPLARASSNASSHSPSISTRSPPNIKNSPARFIQAPRAVPAQPIDMNRPVRGAFVGHDVGSVPDSAPDFDCSNQRYRSNSHRSLRSNESNPVSRSGGEHHPVFDQHLDEDLDRLSLGNQSTSTSDEQILQPMAGAFVRKSTSQMLYESIQQPPEIATLTKRKTEKAEVLLELGDDLETNEDEFDDFISGL